MHIDFKLIRNARKNGGLFIGIRYHFPIVHVDETIEDCYYKYTGVKLYKSSLIQLGLILYSLDITVKYGRYIKYVLNDNQ